LRPADSNIQKLSAIFLDGREFPAREDIGSGASFTAWSGALMYAHLIFKPTAPRPLSFSEALQSPVRFAILLRQTGVMHGVVVAATR
jgi:hypothetical protein